ncbi:anchored repeat ABC transporter, substrate-binding protein [Actinomadura alba]|uniref:Anchored repeat ABC transporter, substrate-binding protein n=1 Tax=Actinomadura alba TaxID=406431 RepID=A0ABR7LYN8_9ACTN|nr:anchored repeat ABC transporter, substrate-binding protein [Actinomadura alba]MBC6469498.1 anchored repeat ABC transporter, substrate-binding protein [Actinomadura alba]
MHVPLRTARAGAGILALAMVALAGCSGARGQDGSSAALKVVTTTEILADLVKNVGRERVQVDSLVPSGGDPHSYDPTPTDAAKVAKADATFTNHLLLEEHALIKTIDSNVRKGAPNVSLAEAAETYGATVIPLVENIGLDVLWLGLAVRGEGAQRGATRTSDVQLTATKLEGPGELAVYLTETLGQPNVYFNSADGLDGKDVATLPPAAHTHVNWAFSKPGVYRLTLEAALRNGSAEPAPIGKGTFTFAVGVDPHTVDGADKATILDDGHTDIAADLDSGRLYAYTDIAVTGTQAAKGPQKEVPAGDVIIDVPNRALDKVPGNAAFSFLGEPGSRLHQLPQAVIGKHVHGEIDPHLWEDVKNVKAYVQLIRDTLKKQDPGGASGYDQNTRAYLAELDKLDTFVREQTAQIPADRRQLITTHDAFGYLAKAYSMTVAGFVVPNPAQEPSAEQVAKLTQTIRNLRVPAVFMEPNLAARAKVLSQVAKDQNVRVCKLYGDAFDDDARDYVAMMRHNATELRKCLGGK